MSKTVLFQAIQFSISTQFSSIWPIDRTLSGATTLSQSEPESNGNEGVLSIPQSSSITGTSPSDCLVLYPRHSLGASNPSAETQSVYSTTGQEVRLSKKLDEGQLSIHFMFFLNTIFFQYWVLPLYFSLHSFVI